MAKAGFIMNGATGSTGLTTYYRRNGKTIQRVKVAPANPQTDSQMAQRMIFATVTQAAKFLEPIINHSFESVKYGTKSVNHFVSKNIKHLRTLAAKDYNELPSVENARVNITTKGISQLLPNDYIVADGQLIYSGGISARRSSEDMAENHYALTKTIKIPVTYEKSGETLKIYATPSDLMKAILGLKDEKDQLTFLSIFTNKNDAVYVMPDASEDGQTIPRSFFSAHRLVLHAAFAGHNSPIQIGTATPTAEDLPDNMNTLMLAPWFTDAARNVFNMQLSSADAAYVVASILQQIDASAIQGSNVRFVLEGSQYYIEIQPELGQGSEYAEAMPSREVGFSQAAGAVILSRQTSKKWLRSPATMVSSQAGLFWAYANEAWFAGESLSANERYLNEGNLTE